MEGAVLTLLSIMGQKHPAASQIISKEIGVGWCLQALQSDSGHPVSVGLADALGRLVYRMVQVPHLLQVPRVHQRAV